jgi:primosomal protein N''
VFRGLQHADIYERRGRRSPRSRSRNLEQRKKTMEQAQQKIGQAMQQMEQSARKAGDDTTN